MEPFWNKNIHHFIQNGAVSKPEYAPHVRGVHIQPISYYGRCGPEAPETRPTIPAVLRRIEEQTGGRRKVTDFVGGRAESPYFSFHASYL